MPLSVFDGAERVTRYEYDDAGRLVRAVTESPWTEQDQGWALALAVYRAGLCPSCGRSLSVCTDPTSEDRWVAPPPTRCHATTALSQAQRRYQDTPQPEALLWHVERR